MSSIQSPGALVMIRPHKFESNPETHSDNAFQSLSNRDGSATSEAALAEFDRAVDTMKGIGVTVHVFDDYGDRQTPDSVFPNNWFSTHAGGHIAVYPMYAVNRRRERRWDVIEHLKQHYRVQDVIDYSGLEQDDLALEGTGAMVLDHIGRIAYTVRSNRANPVILERFCTHFGFEPMAFDARDADGRDVYHTNVLMSIGTSYVLICLDMIADLERRNHVSQRLRETGREVIALTEAQVRDFAGNALELTGRDGPILALSSRAMKALTADQVEAIKKYARLLPLHVPTIETAGGSIRCMLAGVHLTPREARI